MKILVFGAGPLGSVLAARLFQGKQDVSLLARGQRLADIRSQISRFIYAGRTG